MRRTLFSILILLLAIAALTQPVAASGPGTGGRRVQLDNYATGPYLLRAVTSPTPPRQGDFNVEVRVTNAETGVVITEATVTIKIEPVNHEGTPLEEQGTHAYAPLPEEYAAHVPPDTTGLWLVTIRVETELGVGEASFYQQVTAPSSIGGVLSVGLPFAGLLLLVLFFFYMQRSSRSTEPKSEARTNHR
ncbi:MAG: hypothetical protein P8X64_13930 [Anaerolineales bacterium]|jgi:hypothetical protein